jgi:hypothetical protein
MSTPEWAWLRVGLGEMEQSIRWVGVELQQLKPLLKQFDTTLKQFDTTLNRLIDVMERQGHDTPGPDPTKHHDSGEGGADRRDI